jgi:short-subunit dehydrogenase
MNRKLLAAIGAGGLFMIARKLSRDTYRDQIVMITGGSRGLGFALAQDLIQRGAEVILLARDPGELRDACEKLGPHAHAIRCDVTSQTQLAQAIQSVIRDFGTIDTFIHNAGLISVGPFQSFTDRDFKNAVNLHLKTAVTSVRLLQPVMNGGGRIAFISSIGGKVGLPHMSAYSATKFALGGFAEAVRPELAADGISLTVAYPGLMRTGSPPRATVKGDAEHEFLWFASADELPLFSMAADRAARKILNAIIKRRSEIIVGWSAKALTLMRNLAPELTAISMRIANSALPKSKSKVAVQGEDARQAFDESPLTQPLRKREQKARAQWNQPLM